MTAVTLLRPVLGVAATTALVLHSGAAPAQQACGQLTPAQERCIQKAEDQCQCWRVHNSCHFEIEAIYTLDGLQNRFTLDVGPGRSEQACATRDAEQRIRFLGWRQAIGRADRPLRSPASSGPQERAPEPSASAASGATQPRSAREEILESFDRAQGRVELTPAPTGAAPGAATPAADAAQDALLEADVARRKAASAALAEQERNRVRALTADAEKLIRENEWGAAKVLLERALSSDPGNVAAHFLLGEVLAKEGDAETARRHYALAVRLDPDSREGALGEARLRAPTKPVPAAPPRDLLAVLQGNWCYRGTFGNGVIAVNGNRFDIREGLGSNSGPLKVLNEREFTVTLGGFLWSYTHIWELTDPDVIKLRSVNGRPQADDEGAKRCAG
jgi:tetratricopeptide (TPR) repeat protein